MIFRREPETDTFNLFGQHRIIDRHNYKDFMSSGLLGINVINAVRPNSTIEMTHCDILAEQSGKQIERDFDYKFNNYGHRCDDFDHTEKQHHIVFAGDSFAVGEGLPHMLNWCGLIHSSISTDYGKCGYFVLGYSGGSVSFITNNIYRYISKFGNPTSLFILLPESTRYFVIIDGEPIGVVANTSDSMAHWGNIETAQHHAAQEMMKLELFCREAQIELIWSSWEQSDRESYKKYGFTNYAYYEEYEIEKYGNNEKFKNHKHYECSRDHAHPGIRYSDGMANILMAAYRDKYEHPKIKFST